MYIGSGAAAAAAALLCVPCLELGLAQREFHRFFCPACTRAHTQRPSFFDSSAAAAALATLGYVCGPFVYSLGLVFTTCVRAGSLERRSARRELSKACGKYLASEGDPRE